MSRQIVTIVVMVVCLVATILLQRRCGQATATLFRALEPPASDGGAARRDGF